MSAIQTSEYPFRKALSNACSTWADEVTLPRWHNVVAILVHGIELTEATPPRNVSILIDCSYVGGAAAKTKVLLDSWRISPRAMAPRMRLFES